MAVHGQIPFSTPLPQHDGRALNYCTAHELAATMPTDSRDRKTWHKPTLYAAVVLLIGASVIGGVVALSALSGVDWRPLSRTPNAAQERSVEMQPYALPPRQEKAPEWPTSPARRQTFHGTMARPADAFGPRGTTAGGAEPAPTVLPSGEFVAAVESGRKVFLPNPAGDCDLVGNAGAMPRAFDDCFAGKRAGR
jgi:hypothetical protein